MLTKVEGIFVGANQKPTRYDFRFPDSIRFPVVIFCHGFKGFKDWGGFNYCADYLAESGYGVFKFNFSHNGTSVSAPEQFVELDSFAINTLKLEMDDIACAVHFITHELTSQYSALNADNISIIGHSKGGVSAMLYAALRENPLQQVNTWATPFNFYRFFSKPFIEEWKKNKIQYILNGRTKQQMPLHISIYEDYEANKDMYDMSLTLPKLSIPLHIFQGSADESVPMNNAIEIERFARNSRKHIIEGANHTFGMTHPFNVNKIPASLKELLSLTAEGLKI